MLYTVLALAATGGVGDGLRLLIICLWIWFSSSLESGGGSDIPGCCCCSAILVLLHLLRCFIPCFRPVFVALH